MNVFPDAGCEDAILLLQLLHSNAVAPLIKASRCTHIALKFREDFLSLGMFIVYYLSCFFLQRFEGADDAIVVKDSTFDIVQGLQERLFELAQPQLVFSLQSTSRL